MQWTRRVWLGLALLTTVGLMSIPAVVCEAGESPDDPSVLTLERIFRDREFEHESFGPARWLEDGSAYTTLEASFAVEEGKDIVRYSPVTGDREIVVSAALLVPDGEKSPLGIDDYSWSVDGTKLLIFSNSQKVWRRNTRGDYWLLDLEDERLRQLGGEREPATMMFAKLSPRGDLVAWVDFNEKDLFVQDLETMTVSRLTTRSSDTIINGTSDWVYEEEFGLRDGYRWSPDGTRIAYWQFDTEGVPVFRIINNTDAMYPTLTSYQYPKVGHTNPACRIGVISASGGETVWFEPDGDPRQHYIPEMEWAGRSREVMFIRLNRVQNTAEVILGDVRTGSMRTVFTDTDEAWIDMRSGPPHWLDEGRRFTWLSERNGWRQLFLISLADDSIRLLTPGAYDVFKLVEVDESNGWAYITASPDDATRRSLYRVPIDGSGGLERVTPADAAGSHRYQISPGGSWAIHTWSSFDTVPSTDLVSLPDHSSLRVLEGNADAQAAVDALRLRPMEVFQVDIGDGVQLDGWIRMPPGFDPERRYPLLIYVYGEPAAQTVQDQWGGSTGLWHAMLAQHGVVVASLDNRGTPAPKGRAWRKAVYRQIGILASADQAAGLRAMLATRPFVDRERVGIWGWSGGGSMTLNALFRYPDLYALGMAVAVVSDQRVYDTIYQERYMGLLDDNEEGYREGSPITYANQLQGELLIVHGTADDNCHYQSFELLVNELIRHNKAFTMMSYPNRTHGISEGENTTLHLFTLLTRFLEDRFLVVSGTTG